MSRSYTSSHLASAWHSKTAFLFWLKMELNKEWSLTHFITMKPKLINKQQQPAAVLAFVFMWFL
jgi:hypothetical protein